MLISCTKNEKLWQGIFEVGLYILLYNPIHCLLFPDWTGTSRESYHSPPMLNSVLRYLVKPLPEYNQSPNASILESSGACGRVALVDSGL